MFSTPDCNTSDSAFLCGLGDHQRTTLIARFQPDAAVPPRAEDVVVFSPACSTLRGMTGSVVSRQSGRLKPFQPKNTLCPLDGHAFTPGHDCALLRYLQHLRHVRLMRRPAEGFSQLLGSTRNLRPLDFGPQRENFTFIISSLSSNS